MLGIKPQDIISALFNPDDMVNIRIFSDRGDPLFAKGLNLEVKAASFSLKEEELRRHNEKFRAITIVVNTGGRDDKNIVKINAQFMEKDDIPIPDQQKLIDEFPLKPSMIVKTRKSLHTYWFMKDAKVELFRPIQLALCKHFNSDTNCQNESRAMRLPGFNHCKEEPIEVTCISFHPELRYTQEELMKYLPPIETPKKKVEYKETKKGIEILFDKCDFIKHCALDAKTLSEHDWYAMITNLAGFEGGKKKIHEISKPYDSYDFDTTENKIEHFFNSDTGPITCKTIAEKGFKCPKLLSGECDCKSPAALCYKALDYDDLKIKLQGIKIEPDAIKNTLNAKTFITKYLFNQDRIDAEIFIQHELKDYFNFKTNDLRVLTNYYKSLNKNYEEIKTMKNEDVIEDRPWYKYTKTGIKFMPKILAKELTKNDNIIFVAQQFYRYIEGVYKPLDDDLIEQIVQDKLLDEESKSSQITDATHQLRLLVHKEMKELNSNPFILNLRNGLYNVLDDTLKEHDPKFLSIVQLNMSYNKNAKCPLFMKYLNEALQGDEKQIDLIQEMLGYFMIASQAAQKAFVIVGKANSGKSVLLNVMNEIVLSKEYVSHIAWQNLGDRFKTAELYGKLANVFGDLPSSSIEDNGVFKSLVGQDYLTVEKKNKDPFSFQSYARLLFSCNEIPKNLGDKSEGFYRRLIIIRFDKVIPIEKRDPNLLDKLRLESDGIFNFALEGLKRVIRNNYVFTETDKNREELQKYREESDTVLSFVKECCELGEEFKTKSVELYRAYKNYCSDSNYKSYGQGKFITRLQNSYDNVTKKREGVDKTTVITGIRLLD